MTNLSKNQKNFIHFYSQSLNAKQAVIEAGYAKDKADYYVNILLGNPKIIQEIEKNISEQIKTLNISKAYIVNKLLKVIEFSIQEEAILDKEKATDISNAVSEISDDITKKLLGEI